LDGDAPHSVASDSFEVLMDDLDNVFDDLLCGPSEETMESAGGNGDGNMAPASARDDEAEVQETFGSIAAVYARPVRQFLAQLQDGPVSTERVEICVPAVTMVTNSARNMGLENIAACLENLSSLLLQVRQGSEKTVDGAIREAILRARAELGDVFPQMFLAEEELDPKDSIIIHSLLRQVPDIGTVTLDKIFGAGLTSFEMLERASTDDLAVTTGIPIHLAQRVCQSVQGYRQDRQAFQTFESPVEWQRLLARALAEFDEHHGAFRRSANGDGERPEDVADRKRHRSARQKVAFKIDMLLAEMGEAQLVDRLQRLPFDSRIKELHEFIGSMHVSQTETALATATPVSEE
jgi:hypothetical protein